jgi:molybdate transport system substrate-binding protein
VTLTFKIVIFIGALAALPGPVLAGSIHVAAAANLTAAASKLGAECQAQTGVEAVFSYGSTAQLAAQIENGAPFDVFLAADAVHVAQLARRKVIEPGSRAIYANGVLALWIPSPATPVNALADLASARVRVIAVAKPELAPYGSASIDALQHAGLLDRVRSRIVYSENISMAKQYGETGNADAVFTAQSLLLQAPGKVIPVDPKLYTSIAQELGIVAASTHKTDAARFVAFIRGPRGREILSSFGYR